MQTIRSLFVFAETADIVYFGHFRDLNYSASPCLINVLGAALLINIFSECSISPNEEKKQLLFFICLLGIWVD